MTWAIRIPLGSLGFSCDKPPNHPDFGVLDGRGESRWFSISTLLMVLPMGFTLWLFNIAIENGPFIVEFPIKTSIYSGFSTAMLNNQMVTQSRSLYSFYLQRHLAKNWPRRLLDKVALCIGLKDILAAQFVLSENQLESSILFVWNL